MSDQDAPSKREQLLRSLLEEMDAAVGAHDPSDPRHRSHGGQHTNGRCCAFGNVSPGTIVQFRWWVQAFKELKQ